MFETTAPAKFALERSTTAASMSFWNGQEGTRRVDEWGGVLSPSVRRRRTNSTTSHRIWSTSSWLRLPSKADQDRTKNSRAAVSASLRDFVSGFSALYGRSTLPVRRHLSLDAKFSCGYLAKDFVFGSLNFSDSQRQVSYRLSILLCHNKLTIFTLSALSGCSWHCFSWGSKPFNFLPVFIFWIQSWPFWMNSSLSWKVETTAVHSPCLTWTCLLSTGYYCSVGAVWIGQSL